MAASGGVFISFEGIDGAGKSTHIEGLAEAFRGEGRALTLTREPGGTPLAEQLRQMVLTQAMDAMTEALLVFAARRDHLRQVIEPALANGEWVLCDRFTDATFAYQGAGRGFSLETLSVLEQWVQTVRLTSILPLPSPALVAAPAFFTKLSWVAAKPTPTPKPERRKNPRRSSVGKALDKPRFKLSTNTALLVVVEEEFVLRVNNM